MRGLLKFVLLLGVLIGYCFNFHYIIIDNGIKTIVGSKESNSISDGESLLATLDMKEYIYYKDPYHKGKYFVIINTENNGIYRGHFDEEQLNAITILKSLFPSIPFKKANPLPWWLFAILFLIILIIPFRKRKKS